MKPAFAVAAGSVRRVTANNTWARIIRTLSTISTLDGFSRPTAPCAIKFTPSEPRGRHRLEALADGSDACRRARRHHPRPRLRHPLPHEPAARRVGCDEPGPGLFRGLLHS